MIEIRELVLHPIQLIGVELVSLNLTKQNERNEEIQYDKMSVSVKGWSEISSYDNKEGYSYLNLVLEFEEDKKPFFVDITYRGICKSEDQSISESQLKSFLEAQSVKLLWPYIREAITDIMVKMDVDPIKFPTVDVLKTMENSVKVD